MSYSDLRAVVSDMRTDETINDSATLKWGMLAAHRNGTPYFGIDVSNHQRTLDWSALNSTPSGYAEATRPVDYALLKLTEGATWKDRYAHTHAAKATAVGVPFGWYHYARPEKADAELEAEAFVEAMRIAPCPHLRPVLDIEHRGTTKHLTQWALTWCHRVETLTGYRPIIYTYRNFADVFGSRKWPFESGESKIADYDLWLADYRRTDDHGHEVADHVFKEKPGGPFGTPIMHQFTGKGRVPGYDLDIDRNTAPSLAPLRVGYRRPVVETVDGAALDGLLERIAVAVKGQVAAEKERGLAVLRLSDVEATLDVTQNDNEMNRTALDLLKKQISQAKSAITTLSSLGEA